MDVTVTGATNENGGHGHWLYKVESDLKTAISQAYQSLNETLGRNAAVAAKDSADGVYRIHDNVRNATDAILTSASLTQAKVAESQFAAADRINTLKSEVSAQFAVLALQGEKNTSTILAAMSSTELRKVQDQLNEERERNERNYSEINFGKQFAVIQSQLNNLEQVQRSTNQAINFGTGAIGPQSSTQNQVR